LVARTGHFARRIVLFLLLLAPLSALGSPVYAQGVGFQGGFTIDPEQAFFGSHLETNELGYNVHFRPGIDGAFGNDLMLASINIDFVYKFNIGNAWSVYQGGRSCHLHLQVRPSVLYRRHRRFDRNLRIRPREWVFHRIQVR
jgi:hypothetical protein